MISPEKRFRLDGQVALVTGASGGIGRSVSLGLAAMGAKIAIAARTAERAESFAEEMRQQGFDPFPAAFDTTSAAETRAMVDSVVAHFGALDILVNSVGLNREQKAEEYDEATFDHVIDTNLKGAMFQAQAAARHMMRQPTGGKQVHIGSVRSRVALRGRGYSAYCASKGGLSMLCQQLAAEWAPHRIRVNVVAPTFVRTEMIAYMLSDAEFMKMALSRIPLGRICEPEEVMSAVLFLASPASDFITGQTLYMDGGVTATQ
jgi:gluconate 5-dehydrogenase